MVIASLVPSIVVLLRHGFGHVFVPSRCCSHENSQLQGKTVKTLSGTPVISDLRLIPMTVNEVNGISPILSTKLHKIFMFFRSLHAWNVTEWT